jgi:co-chaperonin GroES (HSP10)
MLIQPVAVEVAVAAAAALLAAAFKESKHLRSHHVHASTVSLKPLAYSQHSCWLLLLQSGDRVVYSKYAGTDVQVSGEEHVLLKVGSCIVTNSVPHTCTAACNSLQRCGCRLQVAVCKAKQHAR